MTRWMPLVGFALVAGCSNLEEVESGVVALEVTAPSPAIVEVNEALQLSARALNRNGDSVAATITWTAADPNILIVNPASGIVTGVSPGIGRIQASVGSLASDLLTFSVIAPADTLIIAGDSVLAITDPATESPALTVRLESFSPAGPADGRPVIYALTSPDPAVTPPAVILPNGLTEDTVVTGSDGGAGVVLTRVAGVAAPDTAIVTVRASRTRGAPVPGSGQRFIVLFQ